MPTPTLRGFVVPALAALLVAAGPPDLGRAPDFKLPRHDGGEVVLSQLLRQGPVVLDFWATWCVPCKRALPHYQVLQQRYAAHGVTFVAVSQDDPRSQSKVTPYVRSQQLTFPVVLDGEKRVSRQFKVTEIPTSLLISPQGRIVAVHVGYQDGDEAQLEREIRAVLGLPARDAEDEGGASAPDSPDGDAGNAR